MVSLVLVHGAWHGSWCWDELINELSDVDVIAADLPSVSGDPSAGLYDDARLVRSAVESIDGPVVVGAHSYGGVVVSQALAGLANVSHIVFISAMLPQCGDILLAEGADPPGWWRITDDGLFIEVVDPVENFYHDIPADKAARAVSRLRLQTTAILREAVTEAAWKTIPSTYVLCADDQVSPVSVQQAFADRAGAVRTMHTSHSPFLSQPRELAEIFRSVR